MTIQLHKDASGVLRQRITLEQHVLYADVDTVLGGEDSAPSPHDLFDASLAACKAITVLMYARRKQIPLDSVDVEIKRDASQEAKGQYHLQVRLGFNGALDAAQREQLATIAGKCPVHKLMTQATVTIDTATL